MASAKHAELKNNRTCQSKCHQFNNSSVYIGRYNVTIGLGEGIAGLWKLGKNKEKNIKTAIKKSKTNISFFAIYKRS